MTKARRSEGPRAPLFYSGAALLLLFATITKAQTVELSTLEQCAGLETEELKLACFEAIIAGSKAPATPEPEAVDVPLSEPPVAEVEAAPEAEPAVEVTKKVAPAGAAAAIAVTAEAAAAPTPVTPEPSSVAPAISPDRADISRLGEEYLDPPKDEEKDKKDEVYYATVTEVSEGRNEVLYFHFDNGQVWRQIEGRHFQYPRSGEFDVRITRGMMGEYRMRIGEKGRMVRIRRVQ
jgi:hypothetical protein